MRTVAKFAAIALIAAPTFAAADTATTATTPAASEDALITTSSQGGLFGLGLGGAGGGALTALAVVGLSTLAIIAADGT